VEHERDASAVDVGRRTYDGAEAVVVEWDFTVRGGTFGRHEADLFVAGCAEAAATRTPLVTVLRSGGTRLQEGMRALVGIPRATLALQHLRAARVPHIAVAGRPTTGGVWVAIGAHADLRVGVAGATVGFSGPRVIEAMTGTAIPTGANTAESAAAAGLLDDVVDDADVDAWLGRALHALGAVDAAATTGPAPAATAPERHGWDQVEHSRTIARPCGRELAAALLSDAVALRGADDSVSAAVGRLRGRPAVVVALASARAGRATPAGYQLLRRATRLADGLDLALVTLVDTSGADPLPGSEAAGVAPAIAEAMAELLACSAPSIAVVHGEGGSGGALAAATCDVVAVTPDGWFAALAPEGAAAALRTTPQEAADLMRVAPAELISDGFADAAVPEDPGLMGEWVAVTIDRLRAMHPDARRQQRHERWAGPLRPR
jgi:acetyl-CoA carboxylase carboxyl transferase subunit beta